jgi:hypothetical protein
MRLLLFGLTALALFGALARPLILNQVPIQSDLGRYHLPIRDYYQKCLAAGDQPGWCPGLFCGYDLHGEGQGGFDHPWHRLLYATLPLVPAFNLEVFANYPLLFAGAYLLLRRHDFGRDAALAGATAMTFSGFTLPHYPHTNAIAIVAHIPWLLWATDVYWRGATAPRRAAAGAGVSLLTASELLLGYPQYVYFSNVAEGVYVLMLVRAEPSWRRLGGWVLTKLLGVAAGGAQLLPSLEALQRSPRMGYSREFRGTFSLPPAMGLQLVCPTLFNEFMQLNEFTLYAGVLVTLGVVWLWVRPQEMQGGRETKNVLGRWAIAVTVIALPLALGKYTALFRLYLKVPVIGVFRCPCRYLVLVHLASAVLVAVLVRDLGKTPTPWRRLAWLVVIPAAAWVVALAGPGWLGADMRPFTAGGTAWVSAAVISVATVLFMLAARGSSAALPLLVVLGLADLGFFGLRSIQVYAFTDLATYLARETKPPGPPAGRVEIGDVYGNALLMHGYRLTSGYVGLTPPRHLDYHAPEAQRLAGTTWRHDGQAWHAVDGLPRVRFKGSAQIVTDRPGHIEIRTNATSSERLTLAESAHPGWQATLDDQPVTIHPADGDFQAVDIPNGEHLLCLRFAPASRRNGRILSAVGVILIAGWFLFGRRAGTMTGSSNR